MWNVKQTTFPGRTRRALLTASAAALLGGLLTTTSASAAVEPEPFLAGVPYGGTFADPTVMRLGDTYVAAATTTANLNLPMMTSTDLVTWTPRPALPDYRLFSDWRMYNEAMVAKPTWAATRGTRDRVDLMSQWAPSLEKVGEQYVAAFSAAVTLSPRKSCIGIATSSTPLGQYVDPSPEPLVCYDQSPLGAIDPEVFVDPSGAAYLLWKNEGVPKIHPPRLMARQLDATGTSFLEGSQPVILATRDKVWEGGVVENPSMVLRRNRYWLFYSGNAWRTRQYATGYAVCKTPLGPCTKPMSGPLLRSGSGVAGTGGADALVDAQGRLRLAYAAYDRGYVGESQPRRLHVARLKIERGGLVSVIDRG